MDKDSSKGPAEQALLPEKPGSTHWGRIHGLPEIAPASPEAGGLESGRHGGCLELSIVARLCLGWWHVADRLDEATVGLTVPGTRSRRAGTSRAAVAEACCPTSWGCSTGRTFLSLPAGPGSSWPAAVRCYRQALPGGRASPRNGRGRPAGPP
jgi:hypothetical protein